MTQRKSAAKKPKQEKVDPQLDAYRKCDEAMKFLNWKQRAEIIASMKSDLLKEVGLDMVNCAEKFNHAKSVYENSANYFKELNDILK